MALMLQLLCRVSAFCVYVAIRWVVIESHIYIYIHILYRRKFGSNLLATIWDVVWCRIGNMGDGNSTEGLRLYMGTARVSLIWLNFTMMESAGWGSVISNSSIMAGVLNSMGKWAHIAKAQLSRCTRNYGCSLGDGGKGIWHGKRNTAWHW